MDIVGPLLAHRRFPCNVTATRLVVMTDKQAGFIRQSKDFHDRTIQRACISAGEISAGTTPVRHEQCVTGKEGITNQMDHTGRRVARRVDRFAFDSANHVSVAVRE